MRLSAKPLQSSHFDISYVGTVLVDYADCGRGICKVEAVFERRPELGDKRIVVPGAMMFSRVYASQNLTR
jgi:hypothetical protein